MKTPSNTDGIMRTRTENTTALLRHGSGPCIVLPDISDIPPCTELQRHLRASPEQWPSLGVLLAFLAAVRMFVPKKNLLDAPPAHATAVAAASFVYNNMAYPERYYVACESAIAGICFAVFFGLSAVKAKKDMGKACAVFPFGSFTRVLRRGQDRWPLSVQPHCFPCSSGSFWTDPGEAQIKTYGSSGVHCSRRCLDRFDPHGEQV